MLKNQCKPLPVERNRRDLLVHVRKEIVDLQDELAEIQSELNAQLAELEQMKGINAELDAVLAEREAEIKLHSADVAKWKKQSTYNASELSALKNKLVDFESERIEFMDKIDELSQLHYRFGDSLRSEIEVVNRLGQLKTIHRLTIPHYCQILDEIVFAKFSDRRIETNVMFFNINN